MAAEGVVLAAALKQSPQISSIEELDLSDNHLWHESSAHVRGNPRGFVAILQLNRFAHQLSAISFARNVVESSLDARRIQKSISRDSKS